MSRCRLGNRRRRGEAEGEDLSALTKELAGSLGIREDQISLTVSG